MPRFTFTVFQSFKDCLSRQVAEAIQIHYIKDEILNSKNEYNTNHLSRVVVERMPLKGRVRPGRKKWMK